MCCCNPKVNSTLVGVIVGVSLGTTFSQERYTDVNDVTGDKYDLDKGQHYGYYYLDQSILLKYTFVHHPLIHCTAVYHNKLVMLKDLVCSNYRFHVSYPVNN